MGGGSSHKRAIPSEYAGPGRYNARVTDFGENTGRPRVFLSFSMRNHAQVGLLRHQAASEGFEIDFVDNSLKEPVRHVHWHGPVGKKIKESDAVICLVGEDTHQREAVSWEVQTAYDNDVAVIPVRVHRGRRFRLPDPIRDAGDRTVEWNLEKISYKLDGAKLDDSDE